MKNNILHTYERKNEFWISGAPRYDYADIFLRDMGGQEFHIKGDNVSIFGNEEVYHNKEKVDGIIRHFILSQTPSAFCKITKAPASKNLTFSHQIL